MGSCARRAPPTRPQARQIAALALLIAGCGGSTSHGGQATKAAATAKQFEQAAISGDGAGYCALLSDSERARVLAFLKDNVGLSGPCPTLMHATLRMFLTGRSRANTAVSAADVRVVGGVATVTLPGDGRQIQLTEVGGSWKVSSLPNSYLAG